MSHAQAGVLIVEQGIACVALVAIALWRRRPLP